MRINTMNIYRAAVRWAGRLLEVRLRMDPTAGAPALRRRRR